MKRPDGRNNPPFLMVGGPADGKFCNTLGDSVRVPRVRSKTELVRSYMVGDDHVAMNDAVEVVDYRKQFWCHGHIAFFVPVDETGTQSEDETLRLLIQGYKNGGDREVV